MSLQKGNLEELRNLIKVIIRKELNEATTTGEIDGGEGPPSTPYWVANDKVKKKKKTGYGGGHKKPTLLGMMLAIDPKLRKTS
jgi:hypothetical protein